jgi:hypothetical protein
MLSRSIVRHASKAISEAAVVVIKAKFAGMCKPADAPFMYCSSCTKEDPLPTHRCMIQCFVAERHELPPPHVCIPQPGPAAESQQAPVAADVDGKQPGGPGAQETLSRVCEPSRDAVDLCPLQNSVGQAHMQEQAGIS